MTPEILDQIKSCCRDEASFHQLCELLAALDLQQAPGTSQAASALPTTQHYKQLFRAVARIRESLDLTTIFQTTATEVRQLLNADRVGVFRFDPDSPGNWGEFVSDDASADYSSTLAAMLDTGRFGDQCALPYREGQIEAVPDIYTSNLENSYLKILSSFHIQASLVVPLLHGGRLWGLLCIYQREQTRQWQDWEIEFVQQVATQLDMALTQAELLQQVQKQTDKQASLFKVIRAIRDSLDLVEIFSVTATQVRHLLNADRVGIFHFTPDTGYDAGEFISEDVRQDYSSVLKTAVIDHCFGEQFAPQYQMGRFQAVADIYNAGLQDCHIEVLTRFQIRANLVVPLRQGESLWGLLCIHQCSAPRQWQPWEIEFTQHIAEHLGVALQQAELLEQTRCQSEAIAQTLEDLQTTQIQLVQTEKMSSLGQLVAGVAHEINNPVNFIYGNLVYVDGYTQDLLSLMKLYQTYHPDIHPKIEEMAEDIELDFLLEDLPKTMNSMRVGAERIREIVLSLRNFARIDEAEMKFVNIHEGIDSTLLILQHRFKSSPQHAAITIVREYGDLPLVECYPGQLNQVFMNLLANAVDALEEASSPQASRPGCVNPTIQITTTLLDEHRVQVAIADNGPGMTEEVQRRLFDPFYTTKPVGKGTGLGLSISHQIVTEWHRGTLECHSSLGQGTQFTITIPIEQRS